MPHRRRLYLDNEINNKYKAERENDPMFNVNGTPVDLLYPINSQFYKSTMALQTNSLSLP